ncbi:Acetyltransferase (GNAT) domain protein [anaerobic digester metagenome]
MLFGEKISIQPFDEKYLENTVKWLNNLEFGALIDRIQPSTIHERKEWFNRISNDKTACTFAIILNEGSNHIGNCGLINIDCRSRRSQFWIYLDEKYTDQGFGKESIKLILQYAFHYLNLNRIYLYVVSTNTRAANFYERCGFEKEGIFRQHVFLKNRYVDAIWFGILKDNFDLLPKDK